MTRLMGVPSWAHSYNALRLFWGGILGLFLPWLPGGFVANEALFVSLFLAGGHISGLALWNFGSDFRLLTHKSPSSVKLM